MNNLLENLKIIWIDAFIRFMPIKIEENSDYIIRYKELLGRRLIIEVRTKY